MWFDVRHLSAKLALLLAVVPQIATSRAAEDDSQKADGSAPATYRLVSAGDAGRLNRVHVEIEVGGDLKLQNNKREMAVPMSVVGKVTYDEKLLQADAKLLTHRASIRHYTDAEATIKINKDVLKPELREDHRLIAAQVCAGKPILFSPHGSLTGDELDLIEVSGNSLFLDLLLPNKEVALSDTWKPSENLVAALLGIDSVTQHDLVSKLSEVKKDIAIVQLTGKLKGKIQGANTEMELNAKYHFNLAQKQVSGFALAIRERREIGMVGPGLDVTVRLKVELTKIDHSEKLSDDVLASIDLKALPERTAVEFESERGGFRLIHDRKWHPTNVEAATLVLRRMDQGEIVAQCNVSSLAKLSGGKQDNLTDFQADVRAALGNNFEKFDEVGQSTSDNGLTVLQAVAKGKVQEIPIEWRYYLVSDKKTGRRMAFAFTLEGSLVERLGSADRELVSRVELFEPSEPSARKPEDKSRK